MTAVNSATAATAATASAQAAATAGTTTSDVADRFLTLLVAQLQNQDPLNPLDNAQVTTQLAQLSTVNGINKLNDTMAGLVASFGATQYLQATALVGRDVLVPGSALQLAAGGKGAGGFVLDAPAENVTVTITDAAGKLVRRLDLGALPAGVQSFAWDGKTDAGAAAAAGRYAIAVTASAGGRGTAVETLASGRVTGVTPGAGAGGVRLQVAGIGDVDLQSIRQVN